MASWLDVIEKRAREAAKRDLPSPKIQRPPAARIAIQVGVRSQRGDDPGEVVPASYSIEGDKLTVMNEAGDVIKTRTLQPGDDARALAGYYVRQSWDGSRGGFNRRLDYGPGSAV